MEHGSEERYATAMPSYCAFLGHQPHISIAELSAAIPDFRMKKILGSAVLLFESAHDITSKELNTLGGTVAIARKIEPDVKTLDDVPAALWKEVKGVTGKITFGLRAFNVPPTQIHDLYRRCKRALKDHGRAARYVGTERTPAASVLLQDTGLLDGSHGCEMVLLRDDDALWIGRTTAAQDVNAYAKRDMNKPVRDTRIGLLPPKLAQILLNFGHWLARGTVGNAASLTVLDPFCGTGVIPMECLLRRWNVLACDLSLKAANGCEKNLDWIRKEHDILKKDVRSTVWKQDARKPFPAFCHPEHGRGADVIVTESTLGPTLEKPAALRLAQSLKTEGEALQEEFLRNVVATLPGVPVAAMWPVWFTSKGTVRLEKVWDRLPAIGFRIVIPAAVDLSITGRPTLLYRRPGQYVGREIILLQQVKK